MARYFLDTEFVEDGKTIDLISIGMVCEDGREFYAVNDDCDYRKANDWVKRFVLEPMGILFLPDGQLFAERGLDNFHLNASMPPKTIAHKLALFLGCEANEKDGVTKYKLKEKQEKPEIWGYYADYDWVVFCQLFGAMVDLPKGFPMYCKDLKQLCDRVGNPELPKCEGEHNALVDARWNQEIYSFLNGKLSDYTTGQLCDNYCLLTSLATGSTSWVFNEKVTSAIDCALDFLRIEVRNRPDNTLFETSKFFQSNNER